MSDFQMFEVGKPYLFMTVTHYWAGIVEEGNEKFVKLSKASYVADTGPVDGVLKTDPPLFYDSVYMLDTPVVVQLAGVTAFFQLAGLPTKNCLNKVAMRNTAISKGTSLPQF